MADEIRFTVTDPRGRKVICTTDQWENHILDEHPEAARDEKMIISAIEKPLKGIYSDATHKDRNIYYKLPAHRRFYIKVVVQFNSTDDGVVITAYRASKIKGREKLIWTG